MDGESGPARLEWNAEGWRISATPAARRAGGDALLAALLENPRLELETAVVAAPVPRRAAADRLALTARVGAGESAVVLAKRPSGAVTIHRAASESTRGEGRTLV